MSSDSKSILIACTLLGLGGLGLYLYKTSEDDDTKYVDMDIHEETSLSDLDSETGSESDNSSNLSEDDEDDDEKYMPKRNSKTSAVNSSNTTKKSKTTHNVTRKKRTTNRN